MTRYIRNTVILVKPEVTVGVDSVPTGVANALLVSEMGITPLDAQNVDRNNIRGYFGANEQLVGSASVKCTFTCELSASGTAGTVPAWGNVLLACAMAEATLETPDRIEYTPVSTVLKTVTIYYFDDGVLHKLVGAMGNCSISAKVGDRPLLKFEFTGIDAGMSAVVNAVPTLTAWKPPVVMKMGNVTDITLGATYEAGVLTGGTLCASTGLELNFGNAVTFTPLISKEDVDVTNREVTGSTEFELTAAQEVAFMEQVKSNATQSLSMIIGVEEGKKILLFAPAVQLITPKKVDLNGKRLIGYDLRAVPVAGNDELRIVCL